MPALYDPNDILRCERMLGFAGYEGNLQSVPDCLGEMEVGLLLLGGAFSAGASPGRCRTPVRKESSSKTRSLKAADFLYGNRAEKKSLLPFVNDRFVHSFVIQYNSSSNMCFRAKNTSDNTLAAASCVITFSRIS